MKENKDNMKENKKTLYWIRGNEENPEGVKKALEAKGIQPDNSCDYRYSDLIHYGVEGTRGDWSGIPNVKCIMSQCGVELQPIVEETFKPFDKVIVRDDGHDWNIDFFACIADDNFPFMCSSNFYQECHHYGDWMAKYLGTDTPFEEFRKEEAE